ncbi:FAD-dependent oxidoreductase [Polymorphobacter fuscus]|uniref:Thioredoxin reductase n=1 Tax=Sandarakinorhabdus fusca TaxID=1439888 RepID=A0A7C9GVX3_9SPHN|nr:FAD-dependent oxidoreductase [Polymorphobacter fuscus]KAB7646379.1 FAD-dependent oxidoreductase [Polymorphobacter fuscus]MQT17609.1 FAD-dependent oxidoreductase [Polymorphobacter fuscus]NJC09848.1 thioredoxin reductase (NADPH) [Polymorphobacter fuscus]
MTGPREHQMFPVLDAGQMAIAQRFASGAEQRFAPGESVYDIGEQDAPTWLVLAGSIDVVRRDGLDRLAPVTTHHVGQFTGEVNQLAGRASIAAGHAGDEGCTALPFDAAHLRALMVGSADVGELLMRALILRRVNLIAEGGAGTIIIGAPGSAAVVRLQGFLTRSGYPNMVLDVATDAEGRALVERLGVATEELPLVVCPNGDLLRTPSDAEVAACLGMTPTLDPDKLYDIVIVGAGPAGLATAVYAASEGLSVMVLDERALGGQAGASARIENYLGFPTGISGQALAGRAFNQAMKFGAEIAIPVAVESLDCTGLPLALDLAEGRKLRSRTVVIASGARYRRPDIANLAMFEGAGVSYWVSQVEARLCAGEDVALVGGGNSAGQAVVFLAPQVNRLHLIVRRNLSETMSQYLIDRIAALPNVEIHVGAEVAALGGDSAAGLQSATFRHIADSTSVTRPMRHLFLFIGADPNTGWLQGCAQTDGKGFVITGAGPRSLETSLPGVFAIGDVRAGSTKRVAAAVGEGAAVVAQIHGLLAERAAADAATTGVESNAMASKAEPAQGAEA